ncbi:MAG TPA: tRNA pseudouridine(38-40) synthase TruA [Polyangiaceae bacterium]
MEPTTGILLTVAYDGTAFSGWAAQRDARTVEEVLGGAVQAMDANASHVRGTSRTDAGVHAEAHPVAFDAVLPIEPRGWVLALNSHLPDDLAVRTARTVPVGFNPRFAAKEKRYRYRLLLDVVRDPLHAARSWRVGHALDRDRMREACDALVGTHDFAAFRTSRDERPSTERTLSQVLLEELSPRILSVVVDGNAFMHNMVRILVGTLVDVGRGQLDPSCIVRAFETGERKHLGTTAPAQGLTLERVVLDLPEGASDPWPP